MRPRKAAERRPRRHRTGTAGRQLPTGWWNAEVHGGFALTDLANVDPHLGDDMATIFTFLACEEDVVYPTEHHGEIEAIIARWRPQAEQA
ncbi:DUF7673 family protein [Rhizobium lusitanum]|uniref:DUF7673 family protein n=1 Tax=Rhizobium lusitanum TaxID=293958 RepID=UPI003D7C279B